MAGIVKVNPSGFDYEEIDIRCEYQTNGLTGVRKFKCKWSDAKELAKAFLGRMSYYPPCKFPYDWRAFATRASIEPLGKGKVNENIQEWDTNSGRIEYDYALVTVYYETHHGRLVHPDDTTTDISPQTGNPLKDNENQESTIRITYDVSPSVEALNIPSNKLYWDNQQQNALGTDEIPMMVIYNCEFVVEVSGAKKIPTYCLSNWGKVNNGAVYWQWSSDSAWILAAGTLMLGAPHVAMEFSEGDAGWTYTVRLRALYKSSGWNKFYKSGNQAPQIIYDDSGSQFKPYEEISFDSTWWHKLDADDFR